MNARRGDTMRPKENKDLASILKCLAKKGGTVRSSVQQQQHQTSPDGKTKESPYSQMFPVPVISSKGAAFSDFASSAAYR